MPGSVRRIVTAVNEAGRSYILSDQQFPMEAPAGEPSRTGLWLTDSGQPSNKGTHDPVPDGVSSQIAPAHKGGSVFRAGQTLKDGVPSGCAPAWT